MSSTFFKTQAAFRAWLKKNHNKYTELIVGFHKVGSGNPCMTWSESVDQALCFGWIDGVRRSINKDSYQVRFTPRKPTSIWSAINIKKMDTLIAAGLMQPAGLAVFQKRNEQRAGLYSHEKEVVKFSPAFEKQFKADKKAWIYFRALAPSYKKISINWVMGAKQENTRQKRLEQLIAESRSGVNQWKDNKYRSK